MLFFLPTQTLACQYESREREIQRVIDNGVSVYYCPTGDTIDLSLAECKKFKSDLASLPYNTFDSLYAGVNRLCIVTLNDNNWKLSKCTCSCYSKNYICVHIIAVAVRLDLYEFDHRAYQIKIGHNRKKGRPAKTLGALRRQPGEGNHSDAAHNEATQNVSESTRPSAKRSCRRQL